MPNADNLQPETTMPKRTYTALSGHVIEYDATPALAAFLRRLEDMISDPKATEQSMIGVAYSHENPMLNTTMHPTRGFVTKEVLENPAYMVLSDLLFRKRVMQEKIDVEELAAPYSLTTTEAAERLSVHPNTIRKAINTGRLDSWIKNGQNYLVPEDVEAFRVGNQGGTRRKEEPSPELDIVLGHAEGASLRVRSEKKVETVDRVAGNIVHGRLAEWQRIVVLTKSGSNKRAFVLEPSDEENEIKHPPFHVRGRFTIVEKANSAAKAGELYDSTDVR